MPQSKYNTNLASEFYVLSMLHRLGADALLTLGNKKAVDILVERASGSVATVEVKGLAGTTAWPVDNVDLDKENHFLVFVCYNNEISDMSKHPDSWIIPANMLGAIRYEAPGGRRVVRRSTLNREDYRAYRENWEGLL